MGRAVSRSWRRLWDGEIVLDEMMVSFVRFMSIMIDSCGIIS